jgi:hypothetical protein
MKLKSNDVSIFVLMLLLSVPVCPCAESGYCASVCAFRVAVGGFLYEGPASCAA